eukprot:3988001-Pleurochrysis_carterae.AAC.1
MSHRETSKQSRDMNANDGGARRRADASLSRRRAQPSSSSNSRPRLYCRSVHMLSVCFEPSHVWLRAHVACDECCCVLHFSTRRRLQCRAEDYLPTRACTTNPVCAPAD